MSSRSKLSLAIAIAAGIAAQSLAQPDPPPRKYAVIIGLNRYLAPRVNELTYATADARELKSTLDNLQGYYWAIPLIDDQATRLQIIKTLSKMAEDVRPQDTFLLYYAGHGIRSSLGKMPTYWLTFDADVTELEATGIRLSHLLDYVADIKAEKKIVILDHCFAGDVTLEPKNLGDGSRAPDSSNAVVKPPDATARPGIPVEVFDAVAPIAGKGTLVIAAARGYAYELSSSGHGVLTTALLKALKTREASAGNSGLSAFQLIDYLRKEVRRLSPQPQEIHVWLSPTVDADTWVVAENLRGVTAAEAARLSAKYNSDMVTLLTKNLVTDVDTLHCAQMLDTWVSSFGTGRQLTEKEVRVLDSFRKVMDEEKTDTVRASLATTYINAFLAP